MGSRITSKTYLVPPLNTMIRIPLAISSTSELGLVMGVLLRSRAIALRVRPVFAVLPLSRFCP